MLSDNKRFVFITGGTGFIGSYTVDEFIGNNWHPIVLVHRTASPQLKEMERKGLITMVTGDAADEYALRSAFNETIRKCRCVPERVVHCAGRASDMGRDKDFKAINFDSLRYLTRIVSEFGVNKIVFISSTDVYGLKDFSHEQEEELTFFRHPSNPYPAYKIAAETWLRAHLAPERYSIVRPAAVWGAGDRTLTPRFVALLRKSPWIIHFGPWKGKNRWPLAHVRNVAAAIYIAATDEDLSGKAVHVLDTEYTSVDEFYRMLAMVYTPGKTFRSVSLPFWIGYSLGFAATTLSNLLRRDCPIFDPTLYGLYSASANLNFSNRHFLAYMKRANRQPITREQGLTELAKEVEQHTPIVRSSRPS
ncbi:MAG TPA: NAD(P)-dependent oxidoreductase [Syntrophorhabdaceae bacterium]|nr:NAD(P)-dependent oxidoreductase [Syntrophorhabdaceae bacterium]